MPSKLDEVVNQFKDKAPRLPLSGIPFREMLDQINAEGKYMLIVR